MLPLLTFPVWTLSIFQFCEQASVIFLPGVVAIVFIVVKGFSELHCWADSTYLSWLKENGKWLNEIHNNTVDEAVVLLSVLYERCESVLYQANRHKVTLRSNNSKIVQWPVLSCLFQAHWCKPPFSFSTLAFTGSERRSNGTELGKITVNHSHKPLRIHSCSNWVTPLIRSRNFFIFFAYF